jgi:hypothetical protein
MSTIWEDNQQAKACLNMDCCSTLANQSSSLLSNAAFSLITMAVLSLAQLAVFSTYKKVSNNRPEPSSNIEVICLIALLCIVSFGMKSVVMPNNTHAD